MADGRNWVTAGDYKVKCPVCGAEPNKRCTVPTDTSRKTVWWVHSARHDLAKGWK